MTETTTNEAVQAEEEFTVARSPGSILADFAFKVSDGDVTFPTEDGTNYLKGFLGHPSTIGKFEDYAKDPSPKKLEELFGKHSELANFVLQDESVSKPLTEWAKSNAADNLKGDDWPQPDPNGKVDFELDENGKVTKASIKNGDAQILDSKEFIKQLRDNPDALAHYGNSRDIYNATRDAGIVEMNMYGGSLNEKGAEKSNSVHFSFNGDLPRELNNLKPESKEVVQWTSKSAAGDKNMYYVPERVGSYYDTATINGKKVLDTDLKPENEEHIVSLENDRGIVRHIDYESFEKSREKFGIEKEESNEPSKDVKSLGNKEPTGWGWSKMKDAVESLQSTGKTSQEPAQDGELREIIEDNNAPGPEGKRGTSIESPAKENAVATASTDPDIERVGKDPAIAKAAEDPALKDVLAGLSGGTNLQESGKPSSEFNKEVPAVQSGQPTQATQIA